MVVSCLLLPSDWWSGWGFWGKEVMTCTATHHRCGVFVSQQHDNIFLIEGSLLVSLDIWFHAEGHATPALAWALL